MNNEFFLFDDVMFKKKQNPNEPFHLFIIKVVDTCKTFTLMLLIQTLLHFYNKHTQLNLLKKKTLFMAYIGKKHLRLIESQFIQVFLFLLIINIFHL